MRPNERGINLAHSNQHGVFLHKGDYQKICQALEALKSIRTYDVTKDEEIDVQPTLTELLELVATEKERMTLTYQKKVFLAVVPIEDTDVIEQLEECIDIADIEEARASGGKPIPWEQIKKDLRL